MELRSLRLDPGIRLPHSAATGALPSAPTGCSACRCTPLGAMLWVGCTSPHSISVGTAPSRAMVSLRDEQGAHQLRDVQLTRG